jgi:hypothetical protein
MRSGYLAALSSRTLGLAQTLRPVTPSRFEPDTPHGPLELTQTIDVTPPLPGQGARSPSHLSHVPREPAAREVLGPTAGDPTLMEPAGRQRASRSGQEPDDALLLQEGRPPVWAYELAKGRPAQAGLQPDEPYSNVPGTPADVTALALRPAAQQADMTRERLGPSRSSLRSGREPESRDATGIPGDAPPVSGVHRDETAAAVAGAHAEPSPAAPAIVVRIGRLDVRAVQVSAPPPAPAPRRQPPGPSLEDYLLARDRARR